jgi:uracil-DNA glycosylase family 4
LNELNTLNKQIIECKRCNRLIEYINDVAKKKVKRYNNYEYWGKPLPGFGDINARLLIIGLAPAAHGGNRTGRMFTGDSSGDWLIKALYLNGFANKETSMSKDDGLILKDAYITAVVRCAPPNNKPTREEVNDCIIYLKEELKILRNIRIVLTLGSIAFNAYTSLYNKRLKFHHNALYHLNDKTLISSYHPSRQNTQTGRLSWDEWIDVFNRIKSLLE